MNFFGKSAINKILVIVLAGAVLYWIVQNYNSKKQKNLTEQFEANSELLANPTPEVGPSEEEKNETYKPIDFETQQYPNDCFPKDKLTAEDLLPKDAVDNTWAKVNVAGQGDVKDQNFLNAGYLYGINTQGSSLRNANLQLRSEPPNKQDVVSPWLNSTISSDLSRRPLEIGESSTCM